MPKVSRKQRNAGLAKELVEYFKEKGFIDWRVYFNNQAVCYHEGEMKDIKPSQYFSYGNDKTVAVSFEGRLYRIMNYPESAEDMEVYKHVEELFKKYGYYFEFGNAWNISAFE